MSILCMIGYDAVALKTNGGLYSFMMTVPTSHGVIYTINIEDSLNIKRYNLLNHGQISASISICFEIY